VFGGVKFRRPRGITRNIIIYTIEGNRFHSFSLSFTNIEHTKEQIKYIAKYCKEINTVSNDQRPNFRKSAI
jgi:hypothetical protein